MAAFRRHSYGSLDADRNFCLASPAMQRAPLVEEGSAPHRPPELCRGGVVIPACGASDAGAVHRGALP